MCCTCGRWRGGTLSIPVFLDVRAHFSRRQAYDLRGDTHKCSSAQTKKGKWGRKREMFGSSEFLLSENVRICFSPHGIIQSIKKRRQMGPSRPQTSIYILSVPSSLRYGERKQHLKFSIISVVVFPTHFNTVSRRALFFLCWIYSAGKSFTKMAQSLFITQSSARQGAIP